MCVDRLRAGGVTAIDTYPSYQALIDAAVAGGPKIFCMDGPSAEYYLYRANAARRFRQAFVMFYGHLHRAVRGGDSPTLALIEKGFDEITPLEQKALEDKWLGSPLPTAQTGRVTGASPRSALALGPVDRRGPVVRSPRCAVPCARRRPRSRPSGVACAR